MCPLPEPHKEIYNWTRETFAAKHPEWDHLTHEQRIEVIKRLVPDVIVTTDWKAHADDLTEQDKAFDQYMLKTPMKEKLKSERIPKRIKPMLEVLPMTLILFEDCGHFVVQAVEKDICTQGMTPQYALEAFGTVLRAHFEQDRDRGVEPLSKIAATPDAVINAIRKKSLPDE